MPKSILMFYFYGLVFNLVLIVLMINIKRKKNRKTFLLNMRKIGYMHDFKWYEKSGFFYPFVFSYYVVNFLCSWASVPFNVILVFANIYQSSIDEVRDDFDYIKELLYSDKKLSQLDVFIIHHLAEKNIIPSIVGNDEAVRFLETLATEYQVGVNKVEIQSALLSILSRAPGSYHDRDSEE